jgi:DNA polymerase-3 subunit delta'
MPFSSEHALSLIERAQSLGRLGHAYLVSGPKAADLESFAARVLSVAAGGGPSSLEAWAARGTRVMRPESKSRRITVDQMRDMEREIHMTAAPGGHKFCVIVDAERLNTSAQNAFLRTLEEPPDGTLFLLLTHFPAQLLTTILSRVIEVPLLAPPGARRFSPAERRMLDLLGRLGAEKESGIAGALALKTAFQDILEALKQSIRKELMDEFKKEEDHYKQTTDGVWLKQREEQVEAQIEAAYQQERDSLMDLLLSWVGDAARIQAGAEHLDLPDQRAATSALAERWSPSELGRRLTALRKLHQHLHTNVNESLALEVSLISAFS